MSEVPSVNPGDWLNIGRLKTVVCTVFPDRRWADIEVVYLDERKRAINKEAVWTGDHWEFKDPGPSGGYADRYPRLARYVAIPRQGIGGGASRATSRRLRQGRRSSRSSSRRLR